MSRRRSLLRVLISALVLLAVLVACTACVTMWLSDPRPSGDEGAEAEALTDRMLTALGADAWARTYAARFRLREGRPLLLWDRARGFVEARYDDGRRVLLALDDRSAVAFRDETRLSDEDARALGEDVYATWANDSFWLAAPFKARDPGTRRSVVEMDGERQLLVEYTSGGVTPGDAYLWRLDENGRPLSWRMWVQIIPIGGLEVAWTDWMTTPTGAVLARSREWNVPGKLRITLEPIEVAATLEELVGPSDPFAPLVALRSERNPTR